MRVHHGAPGAELLGEVGVRRIATAILVGVALVCTGLGSLIRAQSASPKSFPLTPTAMTATTPDPIALGAEPRLGGSSKFGIWTRVNDGFLAGELPASRPLDEPHSRGTADRLDPIDSPSHPAAEASVDPVTSRPAVPTSRVSDSPLFALAQPEPFRGGEGEIVGRDFRYASDAFLQRYSFALSTLSPRVVAPAGDAGPLSGIVFRGTAGSISSDEFYSEQEVFWRPALDEKYFFELRYQRQEDFDSRYDRVLTGLGVHWTPSWTTTILSEVVAEKPGIDVHLETTWRSDDGRDYARFSVVLVDVANAKSDDFEYEDDPLTWFADGRWTPTDTWSIGAWLNYNSRLRRTERNSGFLGGGFDFVYDQVSAGGDLVVPLTDEWSLGQTVEGVFTQRSRRFAPGQDLTLEQRFSRRHLTARSSLRREWGEGRRFEAGVRYFKLSERDRRPFDETASVDLIRREVIADVGMTWQISERVSFAPTLFLALTDNEEQAPYDPVGLDDRDEDFLAKINPIFFIEFERGILSLNPSLLLHEPKFGGGNIQLELRF